MIENTKNPIPFKNARFLIIRGLNLKVMHVLGFLTSKIAAISHQQNHRIPRSNQHQRYDMKRMPVSFKIHARTCLFSLHFLTNNQYSHDASYRYQDTEDQDPCNDAIKFIIRIRVKLIDLHSVR